MIGYLALTKEPDLFERHPSYFHPTDDEVYSPLRERVSRVGKHHYSDYIVPRVDNPIRIVIKRDPVKRFISGYTNRVIHHRKIRDVPDFDTFFDRFSYYYNSVADIETHFRPQVQFFGKDKTIFTHIFDVSEMQQVKELFEDTYARKFPDLRLQQGGNTVKITPTKVQEDWIRKHYKDDYDAGWH